MSAWISGPEEVPEYEPCTWVSVVNGGTEPYTYAWSGALTGSNWSITGSPDSGTLYLTVTDHFGAQASDEMEIGVNEELEECEN